MSYYLVLYNCVELKGDPLWFGILYGVSEGIGVMLTETLAQCTVDYIGYMVGAGGIILLSTLMKMPFSGAEAQGAMLIGQIGIMGTIFTIAQCMQDNRTADKFKAVSLEFNICAGQCAAFIIPSISKAPEPIPTLTYWFACGLGIFMMWCVGPMKTEQEEDEKDEGYAALINAEEIQEADC
jgi:hypothetical protein